MTGASTILMVSAAALIDASGRVLVQKRPPRGEHGGLWEFPGGKVDLGESPAEALVRELQEELGVETETSCLIPAGFAAEPWRARHLLLLLFACRYWRGDPAPLHATELKWLHPRDLYGLAMPPADFPLIGRLHALLSSGALALGLQPDR